MDISFQNQVAVITGGSSGIGLACVHQFLASGAKVAFFARDQKRIHSVNQDLEQKYNAENFLSESLSVLDQDKVNGFAKKVKEVFGRCDILINNAGTGRVSTFSYTTDQDWHEELELKYFSQIYPIRAFRSLLEQSSDASIVAINSLLAYQPEPHMVCTSSARAGVQNLLKSLSLELAPKIRVNSIVLGLVFSYQWQRRFEQRSNPTQNLQDWLAELATKRQIPLQRIGTPEEVANAVIFLASPSSSYITGAQLEVSGGLSRYI